MTPTGELFLGIIAFAVMIMALVQVGAIMAGFRLAKRVDQIARQLDEDIKPLLANLTAMSAEAARAAALAARQVDRIDQVFGEMVMRVDRRWRRPRLRDRAGLRMAIIPASGRVRRFFPGGHLPPSRPQTVDDEESLPIG